MTGTVTLNMDDRTIQYANEYAAKNQRSVSTLVEHYFNTLAQQEARAVQPDLSRQEPEKQHCGAVEQLAGILSEQELLHMAEEDERVRYILRMDR